MSAHLNFRYAISLYLFLFNVVGVVVTVQCSSTSEAEVRSLFEFKKGIREDPLGNVFTTWNLTSNDVNSNGCPVNWYGVTCDQVDGNVIGVMLDDLGLIGELKFSTLTGLKMLKILSLSGNVLSGRLVPALGSMTSLERLDLSRNLFYGPVPARINDLWNLHYLNLSSNNFDGGFPSLSNLNQMKVLDLHSNELWGNVGDLFSQMRNVEQVDLSYNGFYGELSIDSEKILGLANTVRYLNLSHNKIDGDFFSEDLIKLFGNLEVLDLGNNGIRGQLPSFGSLSVFRVLRVGSNQLYGAMPEEFFAGSIPVEEVDLSHNGFSGLIYDINSTSLKVLNLSSNVLSGSLPSTLGVCAVIDMSRNLISGDISVIQNWGKSLEVIDLSSNVLSGSFPMLTTQFEKLISIKISNNSLVGDLPVALGISSRLSEVDLSSNQLSGFIPSRFLTIQTLTNLNLSGNQFSGPIPFPGSHTTELLVLPSSPLIESLDLSSNSLTGSMPSDIGNMGRLKLFDLGKNGLMN